MDGRLPDIDYVNMRMENLLDDDQETLIGSEISVTERLKFKECVKQREKDLHIQKSSASSSPHPFFWKTQRNAKETGREIRSSSSSINSHSSLTPSESLQQLTKRIQDLRVRCHWFNSSIVAEETPGLYFSSPQVPSPRNHHGDTSCNEATTPINMPHSYPGDIMYTTPEYLAYTIHMQQKQLLMELALREKHSASRPHHISSQKSGSSLNNDKTKDASKTFTTSRPDSCPCVDLDESSGYHSSDNQRVRMDLNDLESRFPQSHWVLKRHPDGSTYISRLSTRHQTHRHRCSHHNPRSSVRKKHESLTRDNRASQATRRTSSLSAKSQHFSDRPKQASSPSSLIEVDIKSQSPFQRLLFSPSQQASSPSGRDRRFQPILTVTTL